MHGGWPGNPLSLLHGIPQLPLVCLVNRALFQRELLGPSITARWPIASDYERSDLLRWFRLRYTELSPLADT